MKIVRLAKVLETAKDIQTTSKIKKRGALKNIGFVRTTYKDIEHILLEELEYSKKKKNLKTRTSLNQFHDKFKGDIRFAKRDSMTASTNFHKLKSLKLAKRKVSFIDRNNQFEFGILSHITMPCDKGKNKSIILEEIKDEDTKSPFENVTLKSGKTGGVTGTEQSNFF
jgi:hypothetical protein